MDTPMTLKVVRKTKWTDHTAICNTMRAETHAINKEKKDQEKAAVKAAKKEAKLALKANKNIPEEILIVEHVVDPENRNEMVINEEPAVESFDNFLMGFLVK